MRLINCQSFVLEEFVSPKEVRYAILSHTWEKGEEIQFDEFQGREETNKRGWQKIKRTCQLALDDGFDFVWIDTCCIDKRSSAELTEAINSMFPWYRGSEICYAYLADYDASDPDVNMSQSRWFTRGWTLQELIAPTRVHFFDKSWSSIGMKDVLSQQLSLITGIGEEVLLASKNRNLEELLDQVPIARKMSWAANRETTRIEDIAYCLLGIFGVNIPLLYGEGERAFIRFQEEVVKNSNDLSLLAWLSSEDDDTPNTLDKYCGVFAQHPRDFKASGKLALTTGLRSAPDFTTTNKGLKFQTLLTYHNSDDLYVLEINCHDVASPQQTLGIFLKHQGGSVFARARPHLFVLKSNLPSVAKDMSFFLSKSIRPRLAYSLHRVQRCSFLVPKFKYPYWNRVAEKPEALWDSGKNMFITADLQDFVGYHEYTPSKSIPSWPKEFFIVFGYGYGRDPWVNIIDHMSFNNDLHNEAKSGNWKKVAELASVTSSKFVCMKRSERIVSYINVKLVLDIQGGEPVYSIKLDLTNRKPHDTIDSDEM